MDEHGNEHRYYVDYIYMVGNECFLKWEHPWADITWDKDRYKCNVRIDGGIAYLELKLS